MIEQMKSSLSAWLQKNWYTYLKLAFVYAMIFQMCFVFDLIWYDRTFSMLAVVFVTSTLIQFLFAWLNRIARHTIDVVATVIIGINASGHTMDTVATAIIGRNASGRWDNYATLADVPYLTKLGLLFINSWEFYAIGLCAVIIGKLIHAYSLTRAQFFTFFCLGLVLILIVDSFSPIVLWEHAVTLVVLFLLWHMSWHYERIRKGNEYEFEVLIQSPFSLFTPVTIVVSLALIVALIVPYGPPLLEDPYALWKKSRGEEVPAFLGDKGFKTTVSRNQGRQSGYSRNSAVLGGGFDFNYETVMEIYTDQKTYWRGETVNYYNGVGWMDTIQNDNFDEISPNTIIEVDRPLATTKENVAIVNILRPIPYPVIFHSSEIKQIDQVNYTINNSSKILQSSEYLNGVNESNVYSLSGTNRQLVMYDTTLNLPGLKLLEKDHSIIYDDKVHDFSFPSSYRVISEILQLDMENLLLAPSRIEDPVLHELYTSLPETLPQEVADLALLITAPAKSDYERAKLLEDYLKQNYAYANRPNEERLTGKEDDFVYKFLFELYEGYCDYFSTSMAVMAKSLGLPARWVKGFAPGVNTSEQFMEQIQMPYNEAEALRNQLSGGLYNVRNADAHSWVEIYFEGFGWISFEPTPGFSYPYAYVSEESAAIQLSQLELEEQINDSSESTAKSTNNNISLIVMVILGVAIVAGLILIAWKKRDTLQFIINRWRYKNFTNNERIVYEYNQFLRYCSRKGLKREPAQTVLAAMVNWTSGTKRWQKQLHELYQLFEKACYSPNQLDQEQVNKASQLIKSLKKQWQK